MYFSIVLQMHLALLECVNIDTWSWKETDLDKDPWQAFAISLIIVLLVARLLPVSSLLW